MNWIERKLDSRLPYGGGDAGAIASAAAMVAANIYSWKQAKDMPKKQAEANKEVLQKQKEDYDQISKKQRDILDSALDHFITSTQDIIQGGAYEAAFPNVPRAAVYVPVNPHLVQHETLESNIGRTTRSDVYVSYINRLHEKNDLMHCLSMDPRFMVTLDIQSKSVQDMTRGILSIGDVIEVLNDSAEQACLTGRVGNTKRTTARDLGISKMRVQAAGREEFRKATQWANTVVSPLSRQHDIGEMMVSPQQRIDLALHQAQLIQQSLQNKYNSLAQKKPYKLAELQARMQLYVTRLQQKSTAALLVNTHVPNYAATIVPNVSNTSGLVGAIGQGIAAASTNHFFGAPGTQNGFQGGRTGTAENPLRAQAVEGESY